MVQISGVICQASVMATTLAPEHFVVTASSSILFEREVTFDKRRVGMSNHRRGSSLREGGRAGGGCLRGRFSVTIVSMFFVVGRCFFRLRA